MRDKHGWRPAKIRKKLFFLGEELEKRNGQRDLVGRDRSPHEPTVRNENSDPLRRFALSILCYDLRVPFFVMLIHCSAVFP